MLKYYSFLLALLIAGGLLAMEQDDQFVSKKRRGETLESEAKQPKTVSSQSKSGKNIVTSLFDFCKNNAKNTIPQTNLTPHIVHKSRTPECFYPEFYKMLPQQDKAGRIIRYHPINSYQEKPLLGSSTELFEVGAVGSDAACVLRLDKATKALSTKKQQKVLFNDLISGKKESNFRTEQQRLFDAIEDNDLPEVKRLSTPIVDSTGHVKRRIDLEKTCPVIKRNNDILPGPREGHTPLTFAFNENGNRWDEEDADYIIKYLVEECKVNINAHSALYESPLWIAREAGDFYIVKYLLEQGADVNTKDKDGYSLLHDEVLKRKTYPNTSFSFFDLLLQQKNINVCIANGEGETPWMIADKNSMDNVIQYITNYVINQMKNNTQEEVRLCTFCKTDMKDVEDLALTDYGCLTVMCKSCKDLLKQTNPKCPKCRRDMH